MPANRSRSSRAITAALPPSATLSRVEFDAARSPAGIARTLTVEGLVLGTAIDAKASVHAIIETSQRTARIHEGRRKDQTAQTSLRRQRRVRIGRSSRSPS